MLKEEKWMFRCIGALSAKENHKVLRKVFREAVKAVREDVWKKVEPFIGLDPRHDGNAPDFDKKCPKCAAVRELKEKYNAAIRRAGGGGA